MALEENTWDTDETQKGKNMELDCFSPILTGPDPSTIYEEDRLDILIQMVLSIRKQNEKNHQEILKGIRQLTQRTQKHQNLNITMTELQLQVDMNVEDGERLEEGHARGAGEEPQSNKDEKRELLSQFLKEKDALFGWKLVQFAYCFSVDKVLEQQESAGFKAHSKTEIIDAPGGEVWGGRDEESVQSRRGIG